MGPNTLIKQGAKLVATWEDVWEELPSQLRLRLQPTGDAAESSKPETASLFPGQPELSPNERKVFSLIKSDTALHMDELVERLEGDVSASQIFAAQF